MLGHFIHAGFPGDLLSYFQFGIKDYYFNPVTAAEWRKL
jgi:hypothetical protein